MCGIGQDIVYQERHAEIHSEIIHWAVILLEVSEERVPSQLPIKKHQRLSRFMLFTAAVGGWHVQQCVPLAVSLAKKGLR